MALTAEGLFVRLGGSLILKGVYVRVDPGRVTVLFGENGSGKTTLLRAVAGQIPVSSGITIIDDLRLADTSRRRRFKRISYLPQDPKIVLPEIYLQQQDFWIMNIRIVVLTRL